MNRNDIKNILIKLVGDIATVEIIENRTDIYLSANSKIECVGFMYNDLMRAVDDAKKGGVLEILCNKSGYSKEEIVNVAEYIKKCNIKPGQMPIDANHKLVHSTLKMLCKKLTEAGIDYYLVGALPCYLLTGEEDSRYHDDIDIMLNEEDIPKVQELLQDTDFDFEDKRLDTPKRQIEGRTIPGGDHEVVAHHKMSEFHIGFFCFERGLNGEIIHKDYFKAGDGNLMVYKHMISKEQSDLDYDDDFHEYEGIYFKMSSLESTYRIKKYIMNQPGREKDKVDVEMIERSGKLDKSKLAKMDSITSLPYVIEAVDVESLSRGDKQLK